ncbi:UvrD-helicase domain-containing protein [Lederbergia ruris]|uniref:UvrD-helicase domain-containing protein n=1 Tax=Lederbergia ruris TaxID=217495 RepID=UPI0039A1F2B6
MEPTKDQLKIINEESHCVVIAKPGSGKTFTLAKKIKKLLPTLPEYKGVVAISYTNKASNELKNRSVDGGIDIKGSFFGTIDKFYISEIILPFADHIFGKPNKEIGIYSSDEDIFIQNKDDKRIEILLNKGYRNLEDKHVNWVKKKFVDGVVFLELVGLIALYIFDNSIACRRYLKARYSHIIIDEYQDSGSEQHEMFLKIKDLGVCAVAVGDGDQSIFGFAKRDSRYLLDLARKEEHGFNVYSLNKNHRCHSSIINYSTLFLNRNASTIPVDELSVFEKKIIGSQENISQWIDSNLSRILKKYGINDNNKAAILVRGIVTGNILDNCLKTKHKYFKNTPLDNDSNLWSQLFREILGVIYDKSNNKYEMVEKYIDLSANKRDAKHVLVQLQKLSNELSTNPYNIGNYDKEILEIARILLPNGENKKSKALLKEVIGNNDYINSYLPAKKDEIQIMTIHKSKGLEFDVVFHLDLYNYILPNPYNKDKTQDINLHYVGITRAKQALFLLWSTKRYNSKGDLKPGIQSDFLVKNHLKSHKKLITK